jgi:sulfite reductase (NADPH) flavoprotein alpha-component
MSQFPEWAPKALAVGGGAAVLLYIAKLHKELAETKAASSGESKKESSHSAKKSSAPKVAPKEAEKKEPVKIDPKVVGVAEHLETMTKSAKTISEAQFSAAEELSKYLAFKNEYQTQFVARPDVGEAELVKVTDWKLLTPEEYDRTCFHFEIDVSGTNMEHLVNGSQGKALSVYGTNDTAKVHEFMKKMKLNPSQVVNIDEISPPEKEGCTALVTVERLFTQYLDIFGKPSREFLKQLFPFCKDVQEKVAIAELTLERCTQEFFDRQANAYTFADYLLEYPSLEIPVEKYMTLIPTIKQRVYSICSSTAYRPGKCQLLVVREDWQAKDGSTKFGFCSSFLTFLRSGYVIAHSTRSSMQMPEDKTCHVFMAGLGTGLAPFRAYVEERKHDKDNGHKVGGMTLFFGGRYSKAEYYYRDEFEAFEAEGIVKCCNAWSRDTSKKVYVQHKIMEEKEKIWQELGREGSTGHFYLCGSKQPEKDVYKALTEIFMEFGKMSQEKAVEKLNELHHSMRYVTEVY